MREIKAVGGRFLPPDGMGESPGFFSAADASGDLVVATELLRASVERQWPPFVLCEVKTFFISCLSSSLI